MAQLFGFPYFEVQFTKAGNVHSSAEADKFLDELSNAPTTDLLVISHGWNNHMDEARKFYGDYFAQVRGLIDAGTVQLGARKLMILGVLWPSKKFADDELIAGGGANLQGDLEATLRTKLERLEETIDDEGVKQLLRDAKAQVSRLEESSQARAALVQAAKAVIRLHRAAEAEDDGAEELLRVGDQELLKQLEAPASLLAPAAPGEGGAAHVGGGVIPPVDGGAAGFSDFLSGIRAGADRLLNFTTYYAIKERAGVVGKRGVAPLLLKALSRASDLKLHFIGHSFGGRLLVATASGLPKGPDAPLRTMVLLQAAFSHHGFSGKFGKNQKGFFRQVIDEAKVNGPIIVTHTANDRAVGLAYAIASRVARDDASAVGDANDRFGGIGRNGAQKTAEAINGAKLRNAAVSFEAGRIHNLLADDVISSHSAVCQPATARVLLEAIVAAG